MGVDPTTGAGSGELRDWDLYDYIVVIPSVSGTTPIHDVAFGYDGSVAYDPTLIGGPDVSGGFKLISAFPSPYVIADGSELKMSYSLDQRYDRDQIGIWIYDASGARVLKLPNDALAFTSPGRHDGGIIWSGKNGSGEYVASGIYIIHMEGGSKSSQIKIVVINGTR